MGKYGFVTASTMDYPDDRLLFGGGSSYMADKRKAAELEAHKERVRQVFSRSFGAAMNSSEWMQALMYVESAISPEELKRVCDSFDIVWKDEGDMATKNEQIDHLKAQIAELSGQVEKLEHGRMGKEPANGTVLKIEKKYSLSSGDKYSFSAIKAGGLWYLTGVGNDGTKSYSWEGLKKFIGDHSRVWLMTTKKEFL